MTELTPLCLLSREFETDKGGQHSIGGAVEHCHEYTPVYDMLLGDYRKDVRSVLEIGINTGRSLRMWKRYFPGALIVGIDNKPECCTYDEERIVCLQADQGSPQSLYDALDKLPKDTPKFDLIVDDGSHEPGHQITSMLALLPFLSPVGIYVIEDIGGDPEHISQHIPVGYVWQVPPTPGGRGCGEHEQLLVIADA
jgi:SAM-dependent methyltransferase